MKNACVIVNYNDADTTLSQIRRIRTFRNIDAVVVVDNCSTDDSVPRLKDAVSGNLFLVVSERNGGYGAGNNLGVRYASEILRAEHVLIANPDAVFTDRAAGALSRFLDRHPRVAVAAPVQVNPALSARANIPGTRENVLAAPPAMPLRPWLYDLLESGPVSRRIFTRLLHYPCSFYEGRRAVRVDCVPGSLLMVDTGKFLEAGGYDEKVFLYGEEYVLGQEMRLCGYETALLLTETYEHRHAVSIRKSVESSLARQKLRERAALQYYAHWLGASDAALFFTRLFFSAVNFEVRLFGGRL